MQRRRSHLTLRRTDTRLQRVVAGREFVWRYIVRSGSQSRDREIVVGEKDRIVAERKLAPFDQIRSDVTPSQIFVRLGRS